MPCIPVVVPVFARLAYWAMISLLCALLLGIRALEAAKSPVATDTTLTATTSKATAERDFCVDANHVVGVRDVEIEAVRISTVTRIASSPTRAASPSWPAGSIRTFIAALASILTLAAISADTSFATITAVAT
jgi:hypothetical protein